MLIDRPGLPAWTSALLALAPGFVLVAALACSTPAEAADIHVPADFPSIQQAIYSSADGDRILVEPGTYTGQLNFHGRQIHVKSVAGPGDTVIDAAGAGAAGPAVTFSTGETNASILEGFTITGGRGKDGGGILCDGAAPLLRGNRILDNQAERGCGIAMLRSDGAVLENNHIEGNRLVDAGPGSDPAAGGGILLLDSRATIRGCRIEGNRITGRGGGIASIRSSTTIIECAIIGNRLEPADGTRSEGAGIYIEGTGDAWLVGNEIRANHAGDAADKGRGGGVAVGLGAAVLLEDNEIADNRVDGEGGGISVATAWADLQGNRIRGNSATRFGGGAYYFLSDVRGSSTQFHGNHAESGGAVFATASNYELSNAIVRGNSAGRYGGGLYVIGPEVRLRHLSVTANVAGQATGGILARGRNGRMLMTNSIVAGNRGPGGIDTDNVDLIGDVSHCLIPGGWPGDGNIDADPGLVRTTDGRLRVRQDSVCIDGGTLEDDLPNTDDEGDDRIIDGDGDGIALPDIGADEMIPYIAARFGRVGAGFGFVYPTLLVNATTGNARRELEVNADQPLRVNVLTSPYGPSPARFALYAWLGAPDVTTLSPLPRGLGWSAFPTPLTLEPAHTPVRVWNNLGSDFGVPTDDASEPAPTLIVDMPLGMQRSLEITFQGFLEDTGSAADMLVSVTNAVVVRVGGM